MCASRQVFGTCGWEFAVNHVDAVARALAAMRWPYAEQDPNARQVLRDRIVEAARKRKLIYYSDLVRGVEFRLGTVGAGRPFTIEDWTDQERGIVGDFLGMLDAESFEQDGISLERSCCSEGGRNARAGVHKVHGADWSASVAVEGNGVLGQRVTAVP